MSKFKIGDKVRRSEAFQRAMGAVEDANEIGVVQAFTDRGRPLVSWPSWGVATFDYDNDRLDVVTPAWVRPAADEDALTHKETLPPQEQRWNKLQHRTADGPIPSRATTSPDIIPAAVLARRATGYHRGRVSVPTDLDDGLIPDAEPEGIVPRGAR